MLFATLLLSLVAQSRATNMSSSNDQTSITQSLNDQIKEGHGLYTGGKGILVRTPDYFSGTNYEVAPATFWVNDIKAPSQLYPNGNPWCPHGRSDGYEDLSWSKCGHLKGPWTFATVAAVVGVDGMEKIWHEFDKIQDSSWGWGVFYAADANAADKRCRHQSWGWDCPGGWVDSNGVFHADSSKKGAGFYPMGNPDANLGGGGAGCHFDTNSRNIDQVDAVTSDNQNLVQDANCQCNYHFNKDWNAWVKDWMANNKQKSGFEWRDWLGSGGKKAPQWAVDTTICWVNNPRDMISLQNAIFFARDQWLNNMAPTMGPDPTMHYWGWNEVPVTRTLVDDPKNWDAVMIKLPEMVCGDGGPDALRCLSGEAHNQLEKDLDTFVGKGSLKPGKDHVTSRPGSYIVLVREFDVNHNNLYTRQFYCESWKSPSGKYQIVFEAQTSAKDMGTCYLDNAPSSVIV